MLNATVPEPSESKAAPTINAVTNKPFPPPKTDKPRPHICTICTRSFARLEHLKRHERSHTKEKPFACQSCTRCFARRDLLLRHQQKLHSTTTPSSRPRGGRRESTTGIAAGRVRKNSTTSSGHPAMRPRANTLGHVDTATLGIMANHNFVRPFVPGHGHHNSHTGIPSIGGVGFRASIDTSMPRIDTTLFPMDLASGLRTAPIYSGFGTEYDWDMTDNHNIDSCTINPHELHNHGTHGFTIDAAMDFSHGPYSTMSVSQAILDDDVPYEWTVNGFEQHVNFLCAENAIESSPSAVDTNSPANFPDSSNMRNMQQSTQGLNKVENSWQAHAYHNAGMIQSPGSMDHSQFFTDTPYSTEHTVSPRSLLTQNTMYDMSWPTPPDMTSQDSALAAGMPPNTFALPFRHENVPSTASTASVDSSLRHSSIFTTYGDLVSERVRITIIANMSHASGHSQRRQSAPVVSSPLAGSSNSKSFDPNNFPSTPDLQRYASAYFRFCHPHLPFLHLPTLNFEALETARGSGISVQQSSVGGTCLLLSITAIGALYERELAPSRDLFEYTKRMMNSYMENRRKRPLNRSPFAAQRATDIDETPLWLVQTMLLNVMYGHNCGDKTSADVANTHCASLVSLARSAELAKPYTSTSHNENRMAPIAENSDADWLDWKNSEERKRTLYSIFVLSSMLVMAYNRSPALTNSEIRLDLPCDEELWSAESSQIWRNLGGMSMVQSRSIPFAGALTHLLTAAQREKQNASQNLSSNIARQQNQNFILKPSSFGCLVLIHALHNYIWETRQRHLGRQWTAQEIEAMHAHIEPALRAWQAAWTSNPVHVIERPNPFGAGPLPTDSIPLLDLAYVRLFVDFGRSKEAYWHRDYHGAAQLITNSDLKDTTPEQAELAPPIPVSVENRSGLRRSSGSNALDASRSSQRESHLRKAAFYAADHLVNADYFGTSFFDGVARDLPVQSILCACDSAQVLSEWIATLQERVGRYIGVLGRDDIDLNDVPAVIMLDEEDRKLVVRVAEFVTNSEQRFEQLVLQEANKSYGCRVLLLISMIMSQNAVWPGKVSLP